MVLGSLTSYMQENKLRPLLYTMYKNQLKMYKK